MSDRKKPIYRHYILELKPMSTATNTTCDVFLSFGSFFPLPSSHCFCHYHMVGPFSLGHSSPLTPSPTLNNKLRLRRTAFYHIQECMHTDDLCSISLHVTGETPSRFCDSFVIPCGYRSGMLVENTNSESRLLNFKSQLFHALPSPLTSLCLNCFILYNGNNSALVLVFFKKNKCLEVYNFNSNTNSQWAVEIHGTLEH